MKRYSAYKSTGETWLKETPKTWENLRLKDCLLLLKDKTTEPSFKQVGLEHIQSFTGKLIEVEAEYSSSGIHFQKQDILFGKLRPYLSKVWVAEWEGSSVGDIFVFRSNSKILPEFASKLILSSTYIKALNDSTAGAKMPRVKSDFMRGLFIGLPSISEQKEMANYLDRETGKIDQKIAGLEKKAVLYKELKQSLINETVTRGLPPEEARKAGLTPNPPMKDSGIPWIGEIPEHWEVKRKLDIVAHNKRKNTTVSEKNLLSLSYGKIKRKNYESSFGLLPASFAGYQIVKKGNIILRLTDLQNDKKSLRVGLVREQRGIITSAYIGLAFTQEVSSVYFYYLLHYYDLAKVYYWQGGGLRQSMTFDDVKIMPIIIPPLNEQKAIASYLDQKTTQIDKILTTIEQQILTLKELRKTLINDVVTGKICVIDERLTK